MKVISLSDGFKLLGLVNKGVNAELYRDIGEYVDKVSELIEERAALKEENADLKRALAFKGTTVRIWACTFQEGDDEPICSRCAEVDNRPVHFVTDRHPTMGLRKMCPQCKALGYRQVNRQQAIENARSGE